MILRTPKILLFFICHPVQSKLDAENILSVKIFQKKTFPSRTVLRKYNLFIFYIIITFWAIFDTIYVYTYDFQLFQIRPQYLSQTNMSSIMKVDGTFSHSISFKNVLLVRLTICFICDIFYMWNFYEYYYITILESQSVEFFIWIILMKVEYLNYLEMISVMLKAMQLMLIVICLN